MEFDSSGHVDRIMHTVKKLFPVLMYVAIAVSLIWWLTADDQVVYSLFQSPQSPVAAPTNTPVPPQPTNTPLPPPPPTNTPVPAEPTATPQPEPTATPEQAEVQPQQENEPPTAEPPTAVPLATSAEITASQPLSVTLPQPLQPQSAPPAQPDNPPAVDPVDASNGEYVINEVEMIDTIVQWLAYGWMCVGVGFILLALLFFPLLQVRGSHLKRTPK